MCFFSSSVRALPFVIVVLRSENRGAMGDASSFIREKKERK